MPTGQGVLQAGAGGNGSVVTYDDHTNADAGGDGLYSYLDLALACAAKGFFAADGVTPAVLRLKSIAAYATLSIEVYFVFVTIQNGDGVSTLPTSFKDQDAVVIWIDGKTHIVSNVGLSNRSTEYGIEVVGAIGKPTGRNGVDCYYGLAPTLRGTSKMFGSKQRAKGNLIWQPGAVGLPSRLINVLAEATGVLGLGTGAGELQKTFNMDMVSTAVSGNGCTQFNVDDAARMTISAPNTVGRPIGTGGTVRCRDLVTIGSATNGADMQNTSITPTVPWQLVDKIWSQVKVQFNAAPNSDVEDWRTWNVRVGHHATGAPFAGKRVQLLDKDLVAVVDTITTSEGALEYGSGVTAGAVKMRVLPAGSLTWVDRGPFTLIVNDQSFADYDPAFEQYSKTFTPAGIVYLGTERQLFEMQDAVPLGPPPVLSLPPVQTVDLPYFQAQDIAILIADSGQDVSIGPDVTKGYVDRVTRKVLIGEETGILGTDVFVYIETGSLPLLAIGIELSTDGQIYVVREAGTIGDGALTQILCALP